MFVAISNNTVADGPPFVSVAGHQRPGKWANIEVAFGRAVARYIGVHEGGRIRPHIGQLRDNGSLLVTGDDDGRKVDVRNGGHFVRVRFSGRHLGVRGVHKSTRVRYELTTYGDQPAVRVELPRWAWMEPDFGDTTPCPHCGGTGTLDQGGHSGT